MSIKYHRYNTQTEEKESNMPECHYNPDYSRDPLKYTFRGYKYQYH